MVYSKCKYCGKIIKRNGYVKGVYCSLKCKGLTQMDSKGVSREWLHQKYIVEQLGTGEIAKLANRNPKRVYEWLLGYGIETRSKSDFLRIIAKRKDTQEKKSMALLGHSVSNQTREKISKAKQGKEVPNLQGENNGMYGRRGKLSSNWKGGITPDRQDFYASEEWKIVYPFVLDRDNYRCKRCGEGKTNKKSLHVHHIISFEVKEMRAKIYNLVTLCKECHNWVHSKGNIDRDYIGFEVNPDYHRQATERVRWAAVNHTPDMF